jgi:hypothetical protein
MSLKNDFICSAAYQHHAEYSELQILQLKYSTICDGRIWSFPMKYAAALCNMLFVDGFILVAQVRELSLYIHTLYIQGGSNMTGTICV